jgi:acyl-CoA reductase-like NAD-dependent aldehyde dehydrogenase
MTATPDFPTSIDLTTLDLAVTELANRRDRWAQVTLAQRIDYLQECIDRAIEIAQSWADAGCRAKGIDPTTSLAGEEWVAGPISTVRNLRLLITALQANGQPQPSKIDRRADGQVVAQVMPANLIDRVLWLGYRSEVWIEPGAAPTQGRIYREPTPSQVALILGAGNVSAIVAMDVLSALFSDNRVAIVKMNPVNAYVGEYLAQAFAPLVRDGYLQIVYGGADVGEYLCQHPQVETIHITGSHRTHDAIVWGATDTERQQRQAANEPRLTKPITSELGCVTPIFVVPGNWSKSDITFQARHVAASIAHNASFNCAAGQVLVTASGWAQRDEFLTAVRQELAATPARRAYYPGAQQRYRSFLDKYPQSEPLGASSPDVVPWTLIPDVPTTAGEYALTEEAFCGVLAEVAIEAATAADFLDKAVKFANDRLWGTLSCTVLIDAKTQQRYQQQFDRAIADLQYGAIGVNIWSAMLFYFGSTTWGAYPGNTLQNIGSGIGFVHNTYLFDRPQKSIVYAPFRIFPTPAWFATHKNLLAMSKHLLKFEADPTWQNLPAVIMAALRG